MSSKKKLRGVVRIPEDNLWVATNPAITDVKGIKTHLAWPTLDNISWFTEVCRFTKEGGSPQYIVHKAGKKKLHWKLACYTEDGWWYSHDRERSSKVEYETRLFIPRELKFHPDFKAKKELK